MALDADLLRYLDNVFRITSTTNLQAFQSKQSEKTLEKFIEFF